MKISREHMFGFAAALTMAAAFVFPVVAQQMPPSPDAAKLRGGTWDSIKGLPDFYTGLWEPMGFGPGPGSAGGGRYTEKIPFTPKYQKIYDDVRRISQEGGDVPSRVRLCIYGFGGTMAGPEALLSFTFAPGHIVIANATPQTRHIYTDGRKLPDDPDETFEGASIGHWEGDTLVVETAGLDHHNEMMYAIPGGAGMKVVERMFLKDKDTLQIDSVLTAPEALTAPYARSTSFHREPAWSMIPFDCAQNNREVNADGSQTFSLTPSE